MKIVCTVKEFGQIVRGCKEMSRVNGCTECPLFDVCADGFIEQFVSAEDVMPEQEEGRGNG